MQQKFSRTLHGYNPDEVNSFLDDVIAQVERMIESNRQKNEEILLLKNELSKVGSYDELKDKAQKYDELEATLNKAIVMAENTGEHIRRVAKQERDLILEEAKKNASLIINDALVRSEKIEYEASLLRKNIIMFKRKLKNNLEEQLKLVDDIEVIEELE
ncbi:MAG: DivIVA domain-containing protein [Bacilli bacterium]|nr:DivIVA domain-containing protein [Bacilli bacterium]